MISDDRLNEMIAGIRIYADMPYGISINEFSSKDLYEVLEELKQRRECELRPTTKFLNVSLLAQLEKVRSEFKEVQDICLPDKMNSYRLAEELVDLQTACETMLAILKLDAADRADVRRCVIAKNKVRGYYDE